MKAFLKNLFAGGACKLTTLQLNELAAYLEGNLSQTTAEIICHVSATYDVTYTTAGMAELLKRMGFVYKKPTLVPAKADPGVQHDFIEYYETIKSTMGATGKVYFVDGVHPVHNSISAYGWIKKGGKSN